MQHERVRSFSFFVSFPIETDFIEGSRRSRSVSKPRDEIRRGLTVFICTQATNQYSNVPAVYSRARITQVMEKNHPGMITCLRTNAVHDATSGVTVGRRKFPRRSSCFSLFRFFFVSVLRQLVARTRTLRLGSWQKGLLNFEASCNPFPMQPEIYVDQKLETVVHHRQFVSWNFSRGGSKIFKSRGMLKSVKIVEN